MAEKTGEMYIEIGADAKKFHQEMTKVQKTGAKKMKAMAKDVAKAGAIAIAALAAVATGVVLAMGKATKDTIRAALAVDKFSKATGIATDDVQELIYAIEQEHGSAKALEKGLINITKALGDAGKGVKTYTDIFEDLGIEYRNHDGSLKNTMDIFDDLIEKMGEGELTTKEQAAAMKFLGAKIYVDLVPFLKLGKDEIVKLRQEAIDLGYVMSKDVVDSLKRTADSVDAIKSGFNGLRNLIISKIAPALETFSKTIKDAFILIRKSIDDLLPALGAFGEDQAKAAEVGVEAAKVVVGAVFTIINVYHRLKIVYWTVRAAFAAFIEFQVRQLEFLYEVNTFILKKIAIVWDKVFKTDLSGTLESISDSITQFAGIARAEWIGALEAAELATADYIISGGEQKQILEDLEIAVTNFKEKMKALGDETGKTEKATRKAKEEMIKAIKIMEPKKRTPYFALATGEANVFKDTLNKKVSPQIKGLDTAMYIFGESMADAFKKGTLKAADFFKMLLKIAAQLIAMNIPVIGPVIGGIIGSFLGEGGVTIPKQSQPIYAAEGMAIAEKPTLSPGGNIYGERGWEVFMKGHQWTEFIKSMRPTFLIHNYTNRDIVIEEIKGTSESGKYELARIMEDNILQKQRDLDK